MTNIAKILKALSFLFTFIFSLVFGTWISYLLYIWAGYPRGNDVMGHVFKIKTMSFFWPNFNWTHTWGGGMPQFLFYPWLSYPPLALVYSLTHLDIRLILTSAGVLAVCLTGFGIYLFVKEVTKSFFPSFVSLLIYLLTPASWSYAFSGGIYARAFATPFLVWGIWAFVVYVNQKKRFYYLLTTIFLAASFLSHYVVGTFAYLLVFLLSFFIIDGFWNKIRKFLEVFVPSFLLTSYFTIPFLKASPNTKWLGDISSSTKPVTWVELLNIYQKQGQTITFYLNYYLNRLSPFIVPLLVLLGLIFVVFYLVRKIDLSAKRTASRIALLFSVLTLGLIVYVKIIINIFDFLYAVIGVPPGMLHYLSIIGSALVGILIYLLFGTRKLTFIFSFFVIALCLVWIKIQYIDVIGRLDLEKVFPERTYISEPYLSVEEYYKERENEFNFRLGTEDAGTGGWFNVRFPYVPQTRDYFGQGLVDPDQRFYLIYSLFHQKENINETAYLMDWWGVKTFIIDNRNEVAGKYKNDSYFNFIKETGNFTIYDFKEPNPILVATNSLPILFVGEESAYNIFFRDFSSAGVMSNVLIPLHESQYIDDYSLEELRKFPLLFLYNYMFKDKNKSENLIESYIKTGGTVFIEAQDNGIEGVLPFDSFQKTDFGKYWKLDGNLDIPEFAPAVYDDGPWGVYIAKNVDEGVNVILTDFDEPILVEKQVGEGKVIWSGLNLPFHIDLYKSEEESRLLANLIFSLLGKTPQTYTFPAQNTELTYQTRMSNIKFLNPQKRSVEIKEKSDGILFKEFYVPNWNAFLVRDGKNTNLKIYKAGPNFMYVPLEGATSGDQVLLVYKRLWWENLSFYASFATLLVILLYCFDWWIFKPLTLLVGDRLISPFRNISKWWKSEGE